jgi:tRNA pseudouridine55 synthase
MGSKSASDFAVMNFSSQQRFVDGQILLIDKPLEWTSFDVVNKLRWALRNRLGVKKFKVGHAGTLDPLATGVLVICTGRATKAIEGLQSDAKSYTAIIRLGATTPCLDAELPVSEWVDARHID